MAKQEYTIGDHNQKSQHATWTWTSWDGAR